jgi:hypothetical protein
VADRRVQIVVLYATRNDNLPLPAARSHAAAGFVHNVLHRESCPDCLANGRVMPGCETCGGHGYTEQREPRDPYADGLGIVQPYGVADTVKLGHNPDRDAAIARLDDQLAPPVSEQDLIAAANEHPYAWEQARFDMFRRYDYAALERGLERLHSARPGLSPLTLTGLALLDGWMPDPIRAPELVTAAVVNAAAKGRHADPRALAQRDEVVFKLARQGVGHGEIAAQVGLSAAQLRRIVNGKLAAA